MLLILKKRSILVLKMGVSIDNILSMVCHTGDEAFKRRLVYGIAS